MSLLTGTLPAGSSVSSLTLGRGVTTAEQASTIIDGAVSVVPFLDAGSVSQDVIPDFDEIKLGVGVGLRYHTGFGPLRLDVGVPLNPGPDDSPVAVYVSLGQAF